MRIWDGSATRGRSWRDCAPSLLSWCRAPTAFTTLSTANSTSPACGSRPASLNECRLPIWRGDRPYLTSTPWRWATRRALPDRRRHPSVAAVRGDQELHAAGGDPPVDGQEILNFGRQSIPTFTPGHRLNSGPFGTMGVGLPFAVGAKAAKPGTQVICLHGDGSFGQNAMELDTAVRHKIAVAVHHQFERRLDCRSRTQQARPRSRLHPLRHHGPRPRLPRRICRSARRHPARPSSVPSRRSTAWWHSSTSRPTTAARDTTDRFSNYMT